MVGHSTVQPLDSLIQHYPTFGKLDTGLSNRWTVGKKHSPTIGLFDTKLTSHRRVGHRIDQQLDCWTRQCPNIGQFDKALSDNYPTIGMLDTARSKCLHN